MKLIRICFVFIGAFILVSAGCTSDVNHEITNAYVENASKVIIQYTYESFDTSLSSQFDKTPDFTLYGDGRLIYGETLVFPMFSMPSFPGYPPIVYQPTYQLYDMMLSKEKVVEFINYLNDREFLNLNNSYADNPSSFGKHVISMNLKCGSKTIEVTGTNMPLELKEIIDHLRDFTDLSKSAEIYDFQEMVVTCEPYNYLLSNVPSWNFPMIDLDNLSGSVKGKELEGQLMTSILTALTRNSRFFMYNGNTYIVYYKPLLPH